jgi:hypothetical protein
MKRRPNVAICSLCAAALAILAGCSAKGSGAPTPPFPSGESIYVFNAAPGERSIDVFPIGANQTWTTFRIGLALASG